VYEEIKKEFIDSFFAFRKIRDIFPKNTDLPFLESKILYQILMLSKERSLDEVRVSDIKYFVGVTKPAISQSLNLLEDKGYIKRNIAAGDRRSIALTITEKGRNILNEHIDRMNIFLYRLIEKFGLDNMKTMVSLFSQMADIIDEIKNNTTFENLEKT
jgi:DNA-binding MarR family transcriptional regulator